MTRPLSRGFGFGDTLGLHFEGPKLRKCPENIEKIGGDDGDRTRDLSVANAALSQLSYTPTRKAGLYPNYLQTSSSIRSSEVSSMKSFSPSRSSFSISSEKFSTVVKMVYVGKLK